MDERMQTEEEEKVVVEKHQRGDIRVETERR